MKIKSREDLNAYMAHHDFNSTSLAKLLPTYSYRAFDNLKNGKLPFTEKHELFFLGAQTKKLIP